MTKATSRTRARGEFPRLNLSAETRAAFNELLGEAPRLGLDPDRVEAAGLPGLRALLALEQAAESGTARKRDTHLTQLQGTLRLLQYRKHPELVQQLQARAMALQGRGGDTEVAHVSVDEIILPRALQTRAVIEALGRAAGDAGIPLNRLRVGSGRNSINPHTGQPEFYDPSDEEPMEEIIVTAPRGAGINNSALAVDDYGRSPEDISNPDFRRGQGEAAINALPGVGLADASGYLFNWKQGDGFLPSGVRKHPSLVENLSNGNYAAAALAGVGALGDVAPALAPAFRAPARAAEELAPLLRDALRRSNIYDRGELSAEIALANRRDVPNAMTLPEDGSGLNFRWNEGRGGGIEHTLVEHGEEGVRDIPFVATYGQQDPKSEYAKVFNYGPKRVVIAPDWHGEPGNWVVTSYDRSKPQR